MAGIASIQKILCFGDSNTYGFNPQNGTRYDKNTRWSGILAQKLKNKFSVKEAGCNNRTCFCDNVNSELTGYKALDKYLDDSFSYVIFSIGINDLQTKYNISECEFEKGLEDFINKAKKLALKAKIILLCPPKIKDCILNSYFSALFDKNSIEKSKNISKIYQKVAQKTGVELIELDRIIDVSDVDGLHYEKDQHEKLAQSLSEYFLYGMPYSSQ